MEASVQQIYQAYKKCHKGKAKTPQAQSYSAKLIDNIFDTHSVLHSNGYLPRPYTCFVATNGSKPREIYAADFADRVVHHLLVSKLEKIINPKFTHHSCANQIDKGTHFGVNALQKMMRKCCDLSIHTTKVVSPNRHTWGSDFISATQQSSRRSRLILNANMVKIAPPTGKFKSEYSHIDNYYLQLDIHNFFYSIDKKILLSLLARHLNSAIKKRLIHPTQGRDYYQLCVRILRRPQAKNQLSKVQLAKIPPHKQFRNIATDKGLPIGNLTSIFNQLPWLGLFFHHQDDKYLSSTYHRFSTKFFHQLYFFRQHFQQFVFIIQKGKNFIVGDDSTQTSLRHLRVFLHKLQKNKQSYVFVSEQGYVHNRLKQRRVRQLFITNHHLLKNKTLNYPNSQPYFIDAKVFI